MGRKLIDIQGKRFGRITVLSRAPDTTGDARWYCRCDCGQETICHSGNLRTGNTSSCGCLRKQNGKHRYRHLAGQRFGMLVAVEMVPKRRRWREWLCKCDCGKTKAVSTSNLTLGLTISCGCAANKGPSVKFRSTWARERTSVNIHHRRAQKKGSFTIAEVDALYLKQKGKCPNCLTKISRDNLHKDHRMPLALGGSNTIANIDLLCVPCNRRKYSKHPIAFAQQEGRLL